MKHRLIYHLYIPDSNIIPNIYEVHFFCLKRYAKIFDDAIYILSPENPSRLDLIIKYESIITGFGYTGTLKFVIEENDKYIREAKTFKKYILDDLGSYDDGITFFGHSKGATNEYNESLVDWILSIYYMCLNDIDKIDTKFGEIYKMLFYGPYIEYLSDPDLDETVYMRWLYPGSIYWLSTSSVAYEIGKNKNPSYWTTGKWLAEGFPSALVSSPSYRTYCSSESFFTHELKIDFSAYHDMPNYLIQFMGEEQYNKFLDFKKEIINDIPKYE